VGDDWINSDVELEGEPPKKAAREKTVRWNFQHCFLTYPRCNIPLDEIRDFLQAKGAHAAVVAAELHKDGSEHRHAYVDFGRKIDVKQQPRYFDFAGFHPNVQRCRDARDVLQYCTKGGSYIVLGDISVEVRSYPGLDFRVCITPLSQPCTYYLRFVHDLYVYSL